jgi:hypothetical protein
MSGLGGNCGVFKATIDNGGYNISDDATCGFILSPGANGKIIGDNVKPLLSPSGLKHNGGPTETIALKSNSPAIDAIPRGLIVGYDPCPATDQRGAPRPDPGDSTFFPACDIGAFESGNLVWLEPSPLDFGTITIDQSSLPSAVTLNNQSGKKLTIKSTTIGPDFVVVSTTCGSVLKAGQSCSFLISFQPQSTVTTSETFEVFDSASNSPQQVQLQGATPS